MSLKTVFAWRGALRRARFGMVALAATAICAATASAATLTHRWSFNGTTDAENLVDAIDSSITATKDSSLISWDGTNMAMRGDGSEGSKGLILGQGLLNTSAATIEIWAKQREIRTWNGLFEYAVDTSDNIRWRLNRGGDDWRYSIGMPGSTQEDAFRNTLNEPAHFSVTFKASGSGTEVRFMRRNAKTGAIEYSWSGTSTKSIADFADPYLIIGGTMWNDKTADADFDEVRVWSGVLSDDQLTANVLAGPDTALGGGESGVEIPAGATFTVPTVGGYGYRTDSTVTLGTGAKIRFDTTGYFGKGLRFKAAGFTVPSGSVTDYVELSDSTNYEVSTEDSGNTILVQLKNTVAYESTWIGGTPTSAADLANTANWASTNVLGTAFSAAPSAATTVIIPASAAATFTLPSGASPDWGRVVIGGLSRTMYGYKDGSPDSKYNSWRDLAPSGYTTVSAVPDGSNDISYFTGTKDTPNTPSELSTAQIRLDGWFYVTPAQAGFWKMPSYFDDVLSFAIDGEWVLLNSTYRFTNWDGACVSEGWHRFTLAAADTGGGWGSRYQFASGVHVPFAISINGGANMTFTADNFTFGSGSCTATLSDDADWRGLGKLSLDGMFLDLNGHNLMLDDVNSVNVGTVITNSAAKKSVVYFLGEPLESKAYADGIIKEADVKIILAKDGEQVATWTGAVSGDPSNANNWEDLAGEPVVPTSAYTVKIAGSNVNLQIPAGTDVACKSFEIGTCTFTANCDWSGLSKTPLIVGTANANLNGHTLTLNHLAAMSGATFSGGDGSAVRFDVAGGTYGTFGEAVYIDDIANLTLSGSAKILLAKTAGSTITADTPDIGHSHYTEFVQTDGAVSHSSSAGNWAGIGGRGLSTTDHGTGHGVYRMSGGTLTSDANNGFEVGSYGTGEFIQTGGNVTFNKWFSLGRHGGKGTYTISGGAMTNTYNNPVYVGVEGGTGTINISNDASVNVHQLALGGNDTSGNKGYVNISGNGSFVARNWGTLGQKKNGYGEVNQSGGLFSIGAEFTVGELGTGVYNLTAGELQVSGVLWVGRSTATTSRGTFTQTTGSVSCNDLRIGEGAGSVGTYTQNDGNVLPKSWERIGMSGVGTHVQNGGTNYFSRKSDNWIKLGENASGVGTYELNNGLIDVYSGIVVGMSGMAYFTQNDGSVTAGILEIAKNEGGVGLYDMNGGTLATPQIKNGSGKGTLLLNGGTVVATNVTDGANFISGLTTFDLGPAGATIDTGANSVSVVNCNMVANSGSMLTKTGSGTLTLPSLFPADTVSVEQGTLALAAGGDNTTSAASLAHRWSFASDYSDSVGGRVGTAIGSALAIEDGALVMSGNGNSTGSLNLGKGVMPSGDATVEIWATRTGNKSWSRIFDFGTSSTDYFTMSWVRGTNTSQDTVEVDNSGTKTTANDTMVYENNVKYHISVTFKASSNGSTTYSWARRNVETGAIEKSGSRTVAGWTLAKIFTGNFYLGHSQYTSDHDANAIYDEVRIWNGALSADALTLSAQKGPDASDADIAAIAAASTQPVTRALTLASGTTLAVGAGNTLRQPVVNANGTLASGNLVVTEQFNVTVGEAMTVESGATLDLTGADIAVVGGTLPRKGCLIATSASGGIVPAASRKLSGDLVGYTLFLSPTKARIGKTGFTVIVR